MIAITLPIYLIIALGYGVIRSGYVAAGDIRATGKLVMRVALPAMIFLAISRSPISAVLRWDFVLAYLAGSLLVFGAGFALARRGLGQETPAAALVGMGMACSNSAFMGYPVAAMVVGGVALQAFTMAMLVENIVMIPLAVLLGDGTRAGGNGALRTTLTGIARNPLLIAVLAAVAFSLSGLALPGPLERTLAMLAVGGTVASLPFAAVAGPMPWVVAGKLIAHPLLVLAALSLATVPPDLRLAGVLIAAVPMMSIYALFGHRWGQERLAASALVVATVLSFFTISAMLFVLGKG